MLLVVDKKRCCACEECLAVCPVGAITFMAGKAQINAARCVCCGACMSECPQEAITTKNNDK